MPQWSPDGTLVATFAEGRGSFSDVLVLQADGTGQRVLVEGEQADVHPTWSRDGANVLYWSWDVGTFVAQAFIVPSTGDGVAPVRVPGLGTTGQTLPPAPAFYSPDGTRVAGWSCDEGGCNLAVVTLDGATEAVVVPAPDIVGQASWQRLAVPVAAGTEVSTVAPSA
jgi:Tol biopolymer transport system component